MRRTVALSGHREERITLGLVERDSAGLKATPTLRPLLEAMLSIRARVAQATWAGHELDVGSVLRLGAVVGDAASDDHVVAVSHRSLPGRRLRERIEADTNQRAEASFDALAAAERAELLEALRRLPSAS